MGCLFSVHLYDPWNRNLKLSHGDKNLVWETRDDSKMVARIGWDTAGNGIGKANCSFPNWQPCI